MSIALPGALVALIALSTACSANDAPAGGGGQGGDAATGCTPGATQLCYGPAACKGGQVCTASGSWGICDCGAGGWPGSGGSAGAAGSGTGGAGTGGANTGGSAGSGGAAGAYPKELDLHQATIYDNPSNLADWPVTTTITDLEFQYNGSDGVHVTFSKQDGADRWPDVTPPGWTGPLQYTMGMAEYINGKWYASAAIQFWYGLEASGGNVALDNQVAKNWYYDSRWGEMNGYQPKTGEIIGIFVVAGNVRGVTDGSQSPVQERSNVVLAPFPDVNGAKYTY